jgi:hypothetical protein
MKIVYVLFAVLFSQSLFMNVLAQHRLGLSVNAGLGLPAGQLNTTNQPGPGAGVSVRSSVTNHISLVAEGAIMNFTGRQKYGIKYETRNLLSFTAGGRYYINQLPSKCLFYAQLKSGINFDKGYKGFAWEGAAGCILYPATNKLDLSLRYQENLQDNEVYHTAFYSLRIGYTLRLGASVKKKKKPESLPVIPALPAPPVR